MKTVVDVRHKPCPQPVVMTKKAYEQLQKGEEMIILSDSPESTKNIEKFFEAHSITFHTTETNGEFHVSVIKKEVAVCSQLESFNTENTQQNRPVITIKSNTMGHGERELGKILIHAFINTIQEIKPVPRAIIFYNSGIEFVLSDSPVLESLGTLAEMGVDIIVCGTCVNYFNRKNEVTIGTISNMYEIMEILFRAPIVVSP